MLCWTASSGLYYETCGDLSALVDIGGPPSECHREFAAESEAFGLIF
jgi:hypothetical protein